MTANVVRNVWSNVVIFCGHFPDGAEMFTVDDIKDETRGGWYVRQLLGSANIDGGPLMHLMTGNLSFQIEHHLFPDLPSKPLRPRVAPKVARGLRALRPAVHQRAAPPAVRVDVEARAAARTAAEAHGVGADFPLRPQELAPAA